MKTKCILFLSVLFISGGLFAQNTDCAKTLSIYSSYAKNKNYTKAEPFYLKLVENCPSINLAVYQYGGRMYRHFIAEGDPAKKMEYAQALIDNYQKRIQYFPSKTKKGETLALIAQVQYNNDIGTAAQQYAAFDKAWTTDKKSFQDPKALYTYFSLLVALHDAGKKDLQAVFAKYDEMMTKIEKLENQKAQLAVKLMDKKEAGTKLSSREQTILSNTALYLKNYNTIKEGIKGQLGKRADCKNLIPLYKGQFAQKKDDIQWLQVATGMLYTKNCTDTELFVNLVEAQHNLDPSAESALYLGTLAAKKGNVSKARKYYNESAQLETNPSDKAEVFYAIANSYKEQGRYATARNYFRKALSQKPSMGKAYLQIADMYADSANNCGSSVFEKLAVYWVAAEYAERASRVDPSIASTANQFAASYRSRAPSKSMIFNSGKAGTTISIDCWIGESVQVPNL